MTPLDWKSTLGGIGPFALAAIVFTLTIIVGGR